MVSPKRAGNTTRKPKARERSTSFARWKELLKRPGTWILGILGAAAGFYAMTFMETTKLPFMEMIKPLSRYASEIVCEFRKPNRSTDEARFTILVSPLADDDADKSHTRRVLETFYGERGFRPVMLCETLSFGLAEGAETEQTIKRGEDLIVGHQADLLIFGSVISPKNSIKIWAINEHGGCDLRPKPITLRHGNLPDDFDHETKMQLISVTLREIASACRNQASVDWGLFERRIQKMGPFIEYSIAGLSTERSTEIAASYAEAMMLLYANGRGEQWYSKGLDFVLQQIKDLPADASHYRRYLLLNAYGDLLREKAENTGIGADQQAAIDIYDKAVAEAESDTQKYPKYAEAYVSRNCECLGRDDLDGAIRDFDQAIKINPDDDIAFQMRANAYLNKDNYERAIKDYDETLRLNPRDALSRVKRGLAYEQTGDHDRALRDFDRAAEIYSQRDHFLVTRGHLYFGRENYDRAIQDYTNAIALNPTNDKLFAYRGNTYWQKSDGDRAIEDYNQAIKLGYKDSTILVRRGDFYIGKGDYNQAMRDCDQAIDLNPAYAPAFQLRGVIFRMTGQFERAIADFDQALHLDPDFDLALYGRGLTYSNNGQYDLAIVDYDSALRISPDWARPLYGRGVAKLKKGDTIGGDTDIARATEIQKDIAEDFTRLGGRL